MITNLDIHPVRLTSQDVRLESKTVTIQAYVIKDTAIGDKPNTSSVQSSCVRLLEYKRQTHVYF